MTGFSIGLLAVIAVCVLVLAAIILGIGALIQHRRDRKASLIAMQQSTYEFSDREGRGPRSAA